VPECPVKQGEHLIPREQGAADAASPSMTEAKSSWNE
jgi:hypothetical protein